MEYGQQLGKKLHLVVCCRVLYIDKIKVVRLHMTSAHFMTFYPLNLCKKKTTKQKYKSRQHAVRRIPNIYK